MSNKDKVLIAIKLISVLLLIVTAISMNEVKAIV